MNIDIKDLPKQDMDMLIKSLELVSARILESVVTVNQTASSATPEMQNLFNQWVSCLGEEIIRAVSENGRLVPDELAKTIGVTPSTIISLCLTLHRQGKIKINEMNAEIINSPNQEICGCLK